MADPLFIFINKLNIINVGDNAWYNKSGDRIFNKKMMQ